MTGHDPAGGAGADLQTAPDEAADEAAEAAQVKVEAAVAAAQETDELLLDREAQQVAAQVSSELPFGARTLTRHAPSDVRRGFLFTFGGLLAVLLGLSIQAVRHELIELLVAAFVAIGLDPAVRWLVRRGMSRPLAVTIIAVLFLAAVGGFAAAAYPPIVRESTQLVDAIPRYAAELQNQNNLLGRLNLKYHVTTRIAASVESSLSAKTAGGLLSAGTAVISFTFQLVLTLVLVVYFLVDLPRIKQAGYRLVPLRRRPRFGLLTDGVISRVGGYVLGNVATSLLSGLTSYVLLLSLGVPYAAVLSILTGVLDLIPLIGSTIGGVLAALVALAAVSPAAAIVTVIYHVLWRVFEDYLLNPRVLSRTVEVSGLVTIVAVLIGGALLGIVGALIAVPAAAAIQLILVEVVYPARDADQ